MTQLSEKERDIPEVIVEEDQSLAPQQKDGTNHNAAFLPKEKPIEKNMDLLKFSLGSSTLGWCIALMFICILLSIWNPENKLLQDGFDAFKLIVVTILGYIFGSNSSKNNG